MREGPLTQLLVERFETMPSQLKLAARFVLDHPQEVALISMREQAQRAGVSHSTMMRLARWLGLEAYEDMRALYAQALREPGAKSAAKPAEAVETASVAEDGQGYSTVSATTDMLAAQVARLGEYTSAMQHVAVADILIGARRVYCLGLRSEQVVATHFSRLFSLFDDRGTLLDAAAKGEVDALRHAGPGDVMLVVGMAPYARATVEVARRAAKRGVTIVAITDSRVSPLARLARASVIVTVESHSFFRSVTPALAAAEILIALIAQRSGVDVKEAMRAVEQHLSEYDVYWTPSR
ncbi:MurR/RpiR family transcriptional regulator [Labrys okinawensis]|uniref:MurR/RpiR family transcriptional regulator n=1 Tax=Labrys okinawensis TaxID=346911 RepID=A0A2S9QJ43_9HYPH|nr:MurR/RpiR family transcriptional regulator [Labrys okinawensis]